MRRQNSLTRDGIIGQPDTASAVPPFMNTIINGDALDVLKVLQDESIDSVITSPPYFGLRDYGTAKWEGGEGNCDHKGDIMATHKKGSNRKEENKPREFWRERCGKCGARRIDAQIGLEETYEEYVQKLVVIFGEVKRVLKKEGTFWLNLGDSYATAHKSGTTDSAKGWTSSNTVGKRQAHHGRANGGNLLGKNLLGIPWRVAFALQADGWYLRQDIIWAKPNPMPESVTDRCTKSHEYIFLLTKSPKYFFDNETIKEIAITKEERPPAVVRERIYSYESKNNKLRKDKMFAARPVSVKSNYGKRNRRSVWTITTKPFKEAHFATFPETLIQPMMLAGCPKGGIVLDPFFGAGTTGVVAKKLGRNYLGIELNKSYCEMAQKRINGVTAPLL